MHDYVIYGIVIVLLAFIFLMTYRKTKLKYKLLYIYLIILLMDLIGAMVIPSPFEWITFLIFIFVIILIFFNKFTLNIIKTDIDQIFVDKESQIWENFDNPPELEVQSNGNKKKM